MSTVDHSGDAQSVSDIVARLRDTDFIRLVTAPDGDALAATGVLARILDIPFQASVSRGSINECVEGMTVSVGRSGGDVSLTDVPVAVRAVEIARALDPDPLDLSDAVLALAGVVAAECDPEAYTDVCGADIGTDINSQPGVGIPIDDFADGLAHTTLVHAPFSGDREATAEALAGIEADGRTVASMLALSVVDHAQTRAATAIERAIYPYVVDEALFRTLAGYADVLDALARSRPGTGLAIALGHDCYETALDGWRKHACTAHEAVRTADIARHHGLVVASIPGAVGSTIETVARLVREYRSPEPVVLAIADDAIATTAVDRDITAETTQAASAVDAEVDTSSRGQCVYTELDGDGAQTDAFIDAFREAV